MTLALGTTAPLESRTAPLSEAVDSCAKPVPDSNRIPLRRHACHKPNTLQVFHRSTEDLIKRTLALREALYIACPPKSLLDPGLRNQLPHPSMLRGDAMPPIRPWRSSICDRNT